MGHTVAVTEFTVRRAVVGGAYCSCCSIYCEETIVVGAYCTVATSTVRAAIYEKYCAVAPSTAVGEAYCAVATCVALRKSRKTGSAEVKQENCDNEEEECPGRGKWRQKG